jgi:rhodanese-related sulfurtransferase
MPGRTHAFLAALPLVCAFALPAPASAEAPKYPPAVDDLVARARAKIKTMDIAAFKAALDKKAVGVLIDVREPAEYANGHIAGAINVPRGTIEFKIWPHLGYPDKLDMNTKITVYCGTAARSILSAKALQELKLKNVTAVAMRFEEWTGAGYPVVREW